MDIIALQIDIPKRKIQAMILSCSIVVRSIFLWLCMIVIQTDSIILNLILKLDSEYDFKDYAFSKLPECYKAWTGNSMEEKMFDSSEMRNGRGKLTNAGALLADDVPDYCERSVFWGYCQCADPS